MELAAKDIADMQKNSFNHCTSSTSSSANSSKERKQRTGSITIECYRCGGNYYGTKCKIINIDCRSCRKKDHLVCRACSKSSKSATATSTSRGQPTHTLEQSEAKPDQSPSTSNQTNQPNNAYPMFTFPGKGQPIVVIDLL